MTLLVDALTWQGITIGGADSDLLLADGIEGLGSLSSDSESTPRALGGSWGGIDTPGEPTITANTYLVAEPGEGGVLDFSPLHAVRSSMRARPQPTDELPLSWSGLMWPAEHCVYVRPRQCEWLTGEQALDGVPGLDLQWVGTDSTIYDVAVAQRLWGSGSPVTSDEFELANSGDLVPYARRAFELRMTAHGTLHHPFVRVEHGDGTMEQITFEVDMTGGQVLTVGDDLVPRVGSRIVAVRSITELGIPSIAPRWWLLHPSTGDDGANAVTIGRGSGGSISGYLNTRGTR